LADEHWHKAITARIDRCEWTLPRSSPPWPWRLEYLVLECRWPVEAGEIGHFVEHQVETQ
jgi:hypothetical protein